MLSQTGILVKYQTSTQRPSAALEQSDTNHNELWPIFRWCRRRCTHIPIPVYPNVQQIFRCYAMLVRVLLCVERRMQNKLSSTLALMTINCESDSKEALEFCSITTSEWEFSKNIFFRSYYQAAHCISIHKLETWSLFHIFSPVCLHKSFTRHSRTETTKSPKKIHSPDWKYFCLF